MSAASALTGGADRVSGLQPGPPSLPAAATYTVHLSHTQMITVILTPLVAPWRCRPACTEALCSRLVYSEPGSRKWLLSGCCSGCQRVHRYLNLFCFVVVLQLRCFHEIMGCRYSDGGWKGGGVSVYVHVGVFWLHSVQGNTHLGLFCCYRSNKGPVLHNVHLDNV